MTRSQEELEISAILREGIKLTAEEALKIEERLTTESDQRRSRLLLAGFYSLKDLFEPGIANMCWLIEMHPLANVFSRYSRFDNAPRSEQYKIVEIRKQILEKYPKELNAWLSLIDLSLQLHDVTDAKSLLNKTAELFSLEEKELKGRIKHIKLVERMVEHGDYRKD